MPIYKVRIPVTATCNIYIAAKNKDEARELAVFEELSPDGLFNIQMDAITEDLEVELVRRVNK